MTRKLTRRFLPPVLTSPLLSSCRATTQRQLSEATHRGADKETYGSRISSSGRGDHHGGA